MKGRFIVKKEGCRKRNDRRRKWRKDNKYRIKGRKSRN